MRFRRQRKPLKTQRQRLFRYFRARLHRRLFLWFGVTIFVTLFAASAIMMSSIRNGEEWERRAEGFGRFLGHRLAEVWQTPTARNTLAEEISRELLVGIELQTTRGRTLAQFGPTCQDPSSLVVAESQTGRPLGKALICLELQTRPGLSVFLGAAAVLWIMSGFVSLRITKPLVKLMQVARELGDGKLDSRVRLRHFGWGEFRILADAVNDMADRIEKQMSDQRELLAAVSHELRTPLGHLRVMLELLQERQDIDPELAREIEREILTIDQLVGQLLARSRVDFGTLKRRSLNAVEIAIGALERAGLDPTVLDVRIKRGHFMGDAALILQALANLLRNAEEHGGGVSVLRIRRQGPWLQFEVEDDGPGFDEQDLTSAFQSFVGQGNGSLGLGLSLVRRIAEAHGGRAWAEHRPQGGARVIFAITP